ncbi:MAG: class A beta-lactamase-related serine hydrolase [Elusimicrobia bacterium]|nr:class A beta-lactamase-related serine hydrolase [Elusimicrobiota bacterium]
MERPAFNSVMFTAFLLLARPAALAAMEPGPSLQERLETMSKEHRGRVAVYAKNLKTGAVVAIMADEPVRSASTIKLGILTEAFRQARAGRLKLADPVVMTENDKVQGSGVLTHLRAPLTLALEDVLTLMMIESDNTATNLAIDRVGLEAVIYKKVYKPAEGPLPPEQKKFGLGKTTAREMGMLMEGILRCDLGDPQLCDRMREMMKGQQYRNMIPRYIEAGVDTSESGAIIGDKVGALDAQRSDVGFVLSAEGPLVISAFTDGNADQRWLCENEGETIIARMSKAIFDGWGGPAQGGPQKKP